MLLISYHFCKSSNIFKIFGGFTRISLIFICSIFLVACGGGGGSKENSGTKNSSEGKITSLNSSLQNISSSPSLNNSSIAASSSASSKVFLSISIEANKTVVEPLELVLLYPKDFELEAKKNVIQIDFSGTSKFMEEDSISIPAITENGSLIFRAPVLKMLNQSRYGAVGVFNVRVIQDGIKYSNAITFKENIVQFTDAEIKLNILAYDLIIKSMLIQSSDLPLVIRGEQLMPGKIYSLNKSIVGNADVAGAISRAFLTQVLNANLTNDPANSDLKIGGQMEKQKFERFGIFPDTEGIWAPVF